MARKRTKTEPPLAGRTEIIEVVGPPVWVEALRGLAICCMLGLLVGGTLYVEVRAMEALVDRIVKRSERRSHPVVSGHRLDRPERPRVPIMAITKATKSKEKELDLYEYRAKLVHVVDGDTVDLSVDLGFYMEGRIRFRLSDIDTPEIRGPERVDGLRSKAYVEDVLGRAENIMIRTEKAGKFGRWIADIYYRLPEDPEPILEKDESGIMTLKAKWRHLNKELLEKGLASKYE